MGAIPADPSRIIEKIFDRFLVVVILVPLIGVLVSILVASKVTAPVHAIIEKTERSRAGRKGMFKTFLRTPITVEHKRLYQSVSAMVNELEKREEYAQYFASHVVHELSNPLSAIQGALEIMKEDQSTMSPDERLRFLQIIENNLSSLTQLVDELHAQTKKDRLLAKSSSEIDLPEIADTITGYFSDRNVDIQIEMKSKKIKLTLSSVALESIIRSLIDNSIKHCGDDVSITVRLETIGSTESNLQIDVSDDGPGIPREEYRNVFKPFYRIDKSRSLNKSGVGLGLSISEDIINSHGGSINLSESKYKGLQVKVSLPF